MRIRRVDKNQSSLVDEIRKIPGLTVKHTHMVADGFSDICVGFRGKNYLFEIKDPNQPPSKRKLSPDEEKFHREWTGQIDIIHCFEDVIKILQL